MKNIGEKNDSKTSKGIKIPASKKRIVIGLGCIAAGIIVALMFCIISSSLSRDKNGNTTVNVNSTSSSINSLYSLKDGEYIISVTAKNFCDSVSGKLRSGDIVSAYLPPQNLTNAVTSTSSDSITSDEETAKNPPELQYIKVIAATTAQGIDTDEKDKKSSSNSASNNQPATVTLLVNARQAAILAGAENNTIHFALAYRGGGTKAAELLKKQSDYFKSLCTSSSSAAASTPTASKASSNTLNTSSENTSSVVEVTK